MTCKEMDMTYICDGRRPLGQVVEGAAEVEQSHVEALQQGESLPEDRHSREAGPPLGLRQQPHHPLHPPPQPGLQAPGPARRLPMPRPPAFQLVLQAHQHLLQQVREEGVEEDKEAPPGPRGDPVFSGVHLDHVDVLLAQGLVTWGGEGHEFITRQLTIS